MGTGNEKHISYRRVVDLSHPISPDMPVWPGDPPMEFRTVAERNDRGYFLRRFSMGEHSGTHLASPTTFYDDGIAPNVVPAESLVVPAVVIDVSDAALSDPDYVLSAGDVADWERRNGPVPGGALALLNTGWRRFWNQPARFINADGHGVMHTPGFSIEAARFLLEWREVAGLGIDTHGVDAGADAGLNVSRLALARSALVLECLNNLDQLPPTGATVVVGRLRLVGGSGSPAGVLALVP